MLTRNAIFISAVATGFVAISAPAMAADSRDGAPMRVCPPLTSGKIDTRGEPRSITVTPPAGMMITGYCVKAGSNNAGDGPVVTDLAKSVTKITFTHPSGKAISHYSVAWAPAPKPPAAQAKNQDPKLPPTYTPTTKTPLVPTTPAVPAVPTGSTEPKGSTQASGSTQAGELKLTQTTGSPGTDAEPLSPVSSGTAAAQVSLVTSSPRVDALPNTGAGTNAGLAALGALLVGAGAWLTRRARA